MHGNRLADELYERLGFDKAKAALKRGLLVVNSKAPQRPKRRGGPKDTPVIVGVKEGVKS